MRVLPIIIVGLVFASAAFLVQPAQAQPISTLSGDVCVVSPWEGGTCEQMLSGAAVRLMGGPLGVGVIDETQTTGDNGRFTFDNVAQGDYTLRVSRAGFSAVTVAVTAPAAEQRIMLEPQDVVVQGTIKDSAGDAVANARISFWGPGWASAVSDASGAYMTELQAGLYTMDVDAGKRGYLQQQVFVDGSRIDVTLAALTGQDARIAGRITDQDGQPVAGADIMVDQWERRSGAQAEYGNFRNWTTSDAQGRYDVSVYGGSLSVRFSKAGYSESYEWHEIAAGQTVTVDAQLAKYPEKTARLVGKVVDDQGRPLSAVSISIQHPEYGLYSCSIDDRHGGSPKPMMASEGPMVEDAYYDPGCDITIREDGTFTGNVTPGYALLNVWFDHWATCSEGHTSSGGHAGGCGPDYFGHAQTLVLQPDAQHDLTITLRERPGPDAVVSGYLLDGGQGVPQAFISFNNQETYAWGSAQTDKDGSYKMRVRSGFHHVNVWADGYLPWQGTLFIAKGSDTPLDITLTVGESRHGGCCYAYAEDRSISAAAPASEGDTSEAPRGVAVPAGEGGDFQDLGGGLGPYDATQRSQSLSVAGKQSPLPVGFALLALGLVALRRR